MWDIKVLTTLARGYSNAFHLNHVGYKALAVVKDYIRMRGFHLNHVGYKVYK